MFGSLHTSQRRPRLLDLVELDRRDVPAVMGATAAVPSAVGDTGSNPMLVSAPQPSRGATSGQTVDDATAAVTATNPQTNAATPFVVPQAVLTAPAVTTNTQANFAADPGRSAAVTNPTEVAPSLRATTAPVALVSRPPDRSASRPPFSAPPELYLPSNGGTLSNAETVLTRPAFAMAAE